MARHVDFFMDNHHRVERGVTASVMREHRLLDWGVPREKLVRVYVQDNGEGIPEEIGERLFEPNFTTRSSGMGMGLAIVKKIVEDAGGRVWFETDQGKGTTFIVELFRYMRESD